MRQNFPDLCNDYFDEYHEQLKPVMRECCWQRWATIPEIQEAYLVSGDYDYYIRIAVRDTRDYERLLREKLYKIPGIRHSQSHFVLRVLKEASVPLG